MEPVSRNACDVAIVGAGPYGLSAAAHLIDAGVFVRAFGAPMSFWRDHMPKGMKLRSPWRATSLAAPRGELSLDAYAAANPIERVGPLPLEQFLAYADWFQARAVPDLDRRNVRCVAATSDGFRLELADGEIVAAKRVVVATGLANQEHRPPALLGLPPALVTHACEHRDLAAFGGKRIAVIGRGQSACESAALLVEAGAEVELIARGDIRWLGASPADPADVSALLRRVRELLAAPSAVGPFPLSWLAELPGVVRLLPREPRAWFAGRCLRAAAAAWLKPRFGKVRCNPGVALLGARPSGRQIILDLDGKERTFDHVLLATGYRVDLARAGFLAPNLLQRLAHDRGSPLLSSGFESSVQGLHFVGSYAIGSFGPLMRFIAGAGFAAEAVTRAVLGRRRSQRRSFEFPEMLAVAGSALDPPARGG